MSQFNWNSSDYSYKIPSEIQVTDQLCNRIKPGTRNKYNPNFRP